MNKKHWLQRILWILLWIALAVGSWRNWELILEMELLYLIAFSNAIIFCAMMMQEGMRHE